MSIFRFIFWIGFAVINAWFCKIPFPDSPFFELKNLIAECVSLESHKKKNVLTVTARNRKKHFQSYLLDWFWCYQCKIVQNTNSRFTLLRIKSFYRWVCYFGETRKKICWLSQHQIGLMLSMQWFCIFPDLPYFKLKVLIAECVRLESHKKKSVDCLSKEQRRPFSELSFELALILLVQRFCKTLMTVASFDSGVC